MVRDYQPTGYKRAAWLEHRYDHILPIEKRGPMPITRPDEDFVDHKLTCGCRRCRQPNIIAAKKIARNRANRGFHKTKPWLASKSSSD